MKKNLRTVKTTIVFGLLLASLFIAFGSNASAGPFTLTPYVDATYDTKAAEKLITPIETTLTIDLFIKYSVTGPLVALGSVPEYISKTTRAYIDLEIVTETVPSFCTATLSVPVVNAFIAEQPQEATAAQLQVSVNDNAPGFEDFTVQVKMTARKVQGLLVKIEKSEPTILDVRVKPNFAALVNVELPKGNYLEIPPLNTTMIPIKITNLGNAPTEMLIEIENVSENLNVSFIKSFTLESPINSEDTEREFEIAVKPTKDFSRETIRVKITPVYYRNPECKGTTHVLSFTLKNDGSYVEEEEESEINSILLLVVIVVIILVLIFAIILKKRK